MISGPCVPADLLTMPAECQAASSLSVLSFFSSVLFVFSLFSLPSSSPDQFQSELPATRVVF
jgi:hypothetical protein